jgi:hypothetical protein
VNRSHRQPVHCWTVSRLPLRQTQFGESGCYLCEAAILSENSDNPRTRSKARTSW